MSCSGILLFLFVFIICKFGVSQVTLTVGEKKYTFPPKIILTVDSNCTDNTRCFPPSANLYGAFIPAGLMLALEDINANDSLKLFQNMSASIKNVEYKTNISAK